MIPLAPFMGTMGVCPADASAQPVMPPGSFGGNLDTRQLVRGTTLYLPVQVPGALFSTGDAHCCQGDGEICVTGLEAPMYATMRFRVEKRSIPAPQYRTAPGSLTRAVDHGSWFATTGVGGDLYENAQNATRAMLDHLTATYGLSREDAYLLCSLVVDLKISEIVDAGVFVVSAVLPEAIFRGRPGLLPSARPPPPPARISYDGVVGGWTCSRAASSHALRDRGGGGAALARAREHDRDGHARVLGRREGDEPGGGVLGVLGGVGGRNELGGPGLARHAHAGDRGRPAGAARTTPTIMSRTWPATFALTTRLRGGRWPASHGRTRTPRLAIVAATLAISSGVACVRSCPIAAAPTARLSLRSPGSCWPSRRGASASR